MKVVELKSLTPEDLATLEKSKKAEKLRELVSTYFKPVGDRIIFELIEEHTTAGGIIIPESARSKPIAVPVIAVGELVTMVKPGDYVSLEAGDIQTINMFGIKMGLCKSYNIAMVVDMQYKIAEIEYKKAKTESTQILNTN